MSYDFTNKHAFISGPITDMPNFNREAFDSVELELRKLGAATVFNPMRITPLYGHREQEHEAYMCQTLNELTSWWRDDKGVVRRSVDCIVFLPGWTWSTGATYEYVVAKACGIDIVEWEEAE